MKTVFISLGTSPVFRNLFFFPEGVFEKITACVKTRDDLRFVFVIPKGFRDTYGAYVAERLPNERCAVALVKVPKGRTVLQRAFQFFYSYFVYTGTTRVLATIGIRPDEPPAGGYLKQYLGPIKWLISATFGRWRWLRDRAVPFLWLRIFRGRPFAAVFERYQPDFVFISSIYGPFDTALLAEAKRRGIATLGMISNWDHFDKYFLPFKTDRVLAQSEQVRRYAIDYQGYDPAAITIVGYPHLDFITRHAHDRPRSEVLQGLGFPPGSRYLLYVSGSAYCRDEPEIVSQILRWIEEGTLGRKDLCLVVRPYIGTRPEDREIDRVKFERFAAHPRVHIFRGEFWGDREKSHEFVNMMASADVVFVVYSTTVVEAVVTDRPLVAPTFDGWQKRPFRESIRRFEMREHFRDVLEIGAVRKAYNFDELLRFTREYLDDPDRDADKRQLMRDQICYKTDGESSQRLFESMLEAVRNCLKSPVRDEIADFGARRGRTTKAYMGIYDEED